MPSKPYEKMTCPMCGKVFTCRYTSTWAYKKNHKYKTLYFCSWGCLQRYNKQEAEMKSKKKEIVEVTANDAN